MSITTSVPGQGGELLDHSNFAQPELSPHGHLYVGCIEPRPESRRMRVIAQTAGGLIGEGYDDRLAWVADTGEATGISEGMEVEADTRPNDILLSHTGGCKFLGSIVVVSGELARPSDQTAETISRWSSRYGYGDVVGTRLPDIRDAAARMEEFLRDGGEDADLIRLAGQLYPDHDNVAPVEGQNKAQAYVVNHSRLGLDRESLRGGPQVYHDSLGISIANLATRRGMSPNERGLRLTALMSRSAAVATLLGRTPGMHYYEVDTTENGLRVS